MAKNIEDTRSDFIEKIGMIAQADGLPRIAGRLLGLLVWDGEVISFSDLADRLQVSRGSVSTATHALEERRLIKRTSKPGRRQDYFQLAENPYAKMLESVNIGLGHAQQEIDETLDDIPAAEPEIRSRVAAYSNFYKQMSVAISRMINDMK